MKACRVCNETKSLLEFHKSSSNKDGKEGKCTKCKNLMRSKLNKTPEARLLQKKHNYTEASKEARKIYRNSLKAKKTESFRHNFRYNNDISYKLKKNLRSRLYQALKGNYKTGSAVSDLGCSIEEFKAHIEKQFTEGMTWDNWSRTGWHIDHKTALANFDLTIEEQLLKACNYRNLQPMWAEDNLSKGAK